MTDEHHKATFYARIRATRGRYGFMKDRVDSVKAVDLRQGKPWTDVDEIAVKITISIPDAVFEAYQLPEVVLDIKPAELDVAVEEA